MNAVVACLGSINVDFTFRLERLPHVHEKLAARDAKVGGGGAAANTAVWLSRQGLKVRMHGWVGRDFLGAFALEDLQANGVDTSGVRSLPAATPIAACFALPNDKRIVTSPKIAAPWTPSDAAEIARDADWLHTTVCDLVLLSHLRNQGEGRAVPLSLEMNGRYDPAFARTADYLFTNHDELAEALGVSDPARLIAQRHAADPAVWFITHGEAGATVISGGETTTAAAAPVTPLDRTGGGDAFDAGVVAALLSGADAKSAAAAGLELAAQAITRLGAR